MYGLFTHRLLTPSGIALTVLLGTPEISAAEQNSLPQFLASVDRAEVSFAGRIKYDSSEDQFTYYDDNRDPFGVTMDAGRKARERIEAECDNTSFMVSYSDLCTVQGTGTVEIRGSRIYISIENISNLAK